MTDKRGVCEPTNCNVNTVNSPLDVTTYTYDNVNRLKTVQSNFNGAKTVSYDYDVANNRTLLTYPDAKYATYSFDALNRMATVTASWLSGFTQYTYDDAGRLDHTTLPTGTSMAVNYGYDAANRLSSVTNTNGSPVSSYTYLSNPNGNRTQVTDVNNKVTKYGYDNLDRLNHVEYGEGDCQDYTYDPVGNRKTLTVTPKVTLPCDGSATATTTIYNEVDEIKTMTGTTGTSLYDNMNGNLVTIGSGASFQGFVYDQENRLMRTGPCRSDFNNDGVVNVGDQAAQSARYSAEGATNYDLIFDTNGDRNINPGDGAVASAEVGRQCKNTGGATGNERNWYNGDGLRVSARTFPNGASSVADDYIWDVGAGLPQILQDTRTQSGVPTTTTLLYGLGLIATTDNAGVASYYLADGLGSTTQLVSSSGALTTDSYLYDVFGAPRTGTVATTPNDFRFTGQQADTKANRGLYYLRARHYDPQLGRFLGRDPAGGSNRYVYVANNPGNATDPSGECAVSVSIRAVGGSGSSGGSLGGFHAYIVTADPISGEKNLFEGGPRGGRRFLGVIPIGASIAANGGPLALGYGVPGSSANGFATDRRVYAQFGSLSGQPESCSALNDELHRIAKRIEDAHLPYRILRQNSDAVVSELLQSAGLPVVHPPGSLPSWKTDLGDFADHGAW